MINLYTADLHLTSRDEDKYRWDIFPWLEKRLIHFKVDYLFLLGDLTDRKDEHDSKLVNRLHRSLRSLTKCCRKVLILKGNHDYDKDEGMPYFGYIHRSFKGKVLYFKRPTEIGLYQKHYLFLPHTRNFRAYDYDYSKYDCVFIHQPIMGAESESGRILEDGVRPNTLQRAKRVIAGDVHVPQEIGKIIYCGAPHPLRFGDSFQPRVLLDENGQIRSIKRVSIKKEVVRISRSKELKAMDYCPGDMLRVEVNLKRSEFPLWDRIKANVEAHCKQEKLSLHGLKLIERKPRPRLREGWESKTEVTNPLTLLSEYGRAKKLEDQVVDAGKRIIGAR